MAWIADQSINGICMRHQVAFHAFDYLIAVEYLISKGCDTNGSMTAAMDARQFLFGN